jgi:hypothetical protein
MTNASAPAQPENDPGRRRSVAAPVGLLELTKKSLRHNRSTNPLCQECRHICCSRSLLSSQREFKVRWFSGGSTVHGYLVCRRRVNELANPQVMIFWLLKACSNGSQPHEIRYCRCDSLARPSSEWRNAPTRHLYPTSHPEVRDTLR